MSCTLMRWSGSGQPVQLRKFDAVRPSSAAFLFISSTKPSSEPAIPSASTMQASLPESTIMPRIRSSTCTEVPTCTNILEPPMRQARSETRSSSVSFICPFFSRS